MLKNNSRFNHSILSRCSPINPRKALSPKNSQNGNPKKLISLKRQGTAVELNPPPGCQFLTAITGKYYGCSTYDLDSGAEAKLLCGTLVRKALDENSKHHSVVTLRMTDHGLLITSKDGDNNVERVHLLADEILNIVTGTIRTKSGKSSRVALIMERSITDEGIILTGLPVKYHVLQFSSLSDLKALKESSKRMWCDHMFKELLDVSTEDGQNAFDSFMIKQDIDMATERCSKLLMGGETERESILSSLYE
eukprot:m.340578 g.340578  ORF g.340578 m.340578 type:complete len:251 (+) comp19387_c0_seq1:150-902(+)